MANSGFKPRQFGGAKFFSKILKKGIDNFILEVYNIGVERARDKSKEEKTMKKFVAIGHWDFNKNITCTAGEARTMSEFKDELKANGFTAWMVLSEEKVNAYKAADVFERVEMISNRNRHCLDIEDYMDECMDIIENKLAAI